MMDFRRSIINMLALILLILFLFGGRPVSIHDAIVINLVGNCKVSKPKPDPLLRLFVPPERM